MGQSVTLEGDISPNPGSVSVDLFIYSAGSWTKLKTVSTSSSGHYSYTWTPQEKGTFKFKARWE